MFVLWDTQANADAAAAAAVVRPKLDEPFAGNALRPPEARLFEVLSD